jgi:hypothetical protein
MAMRVVPIGRAKYTYAFPKRATVRIRLLLSMRARSCVLATLDHANIADGWREPYDSILAGSAFGNETENSGQSSLAETDAVRPAA